MSEFVRPEVDSLSHFHKLNTIKSKNIKETQKFINNLATFVATHECEQDANGYCIVCDSHEILHESTECLIDLLSGEMSLEAHLDYNDTIRHNLKKSRTLLKRGY